MTAWHFHGPIKCHLQSARGLGRLKSDNCLSAKASADVEIPLIPKLRRSFNEGFRPDDYPRLLSELQVHCGGKVEFRVAETPIFIQLSLLQSMANEGAGLAQALLSDLDYLSAARKAIPRGYCVADETTHPHFLTADFALIKDAEGNLVPKLVEIQAFPSVFGYQSVLCSAYREVFDLPRGLGVYLGGLSEQGYWDLLKRTVLGKHSAENVVLTEVDPTHQKTFPDFHITSQKLGIPVIDIATLHPIGDKLHYRDSSGKLIPIHRIYNRAIVDELIAREIRLPFDLTASWDVEWAGHPNWYFLISKFSIPWLSRPPGGRRLVPAAAFLNDFLDGTGRTALAEAGVPLPSDIGPASVYKELILKPLFSFAGKGIQFEPTQADLESIPQERRADYLVQQRMHFEATIDTPFGMTQAEIRILYLWPDGGNLTPALSLVRLGRGKMMGVDHNKDQEWVGGSGAFYLENEDESF